MSKFFSTQDAVSLLVKKVKKTKSELCLHSQPHCGQPNHTSRSRAHSRYNAANSVHNNTYSTCLSKQPCSIYQHNNLQDKINPWKCPKQTAKHCFFLLRMSVNTCEKMKKKTKSEFVYTLHHIVVSTPHWHVLLPTMLIYILNVSYWQIQTSQ